MANTNVSTPGAHVSVLSLLAAPFVALGNAMIALGEANVAHRVEKFHLDLTDEELSARGLNRQTQMRQAFGPYISF